MIIEFTLSQVINYPQDRLFQFLSDLENMPLWNYYILDIILTEDTKEGMGAIYKQIRPNDVHYYKMIEFSNPENLKLALLPPGPNQTYGFTLKSEGNKTHVHYHWQVDFTNYKLLKYLPKKGLKPWILSLLKKQVLKKIKPAMEQNFLKLKTLLEESKVELQDGRLVRLPVKFQG